MTLEEITSQKVEVLDDNAVEELDMHSVELGKVIRLADHELQHCILVDDVDGNRFWFPFDGVNVEETLRCNRLYKKGQEMFRDKQFEQKDIARLREVLTAGSVLCNFFENKDEEVAALYDNICVRFAFDMYKKDHPTITCQVKDLEKDEEFHAYIQMVAFLVKSYFELIDDVRQSVAQSKQDIEEMAKTKEGEPCETK